MTTGAVAAVHGALSGLAGGPALSGTVQVDVTGGAGGDVTCRVRFEDGTLVEVAEGGADGADAVLTLTDADAHAVLAGDLDPSVAFMQGRMKVSGSMGVVLDLLALSATDDARGRLARAAASISG
jgi:putative sterol carrier protein